MRILYLCHRFPFPPARGGKIRPFNMIRHLSRKHEVVVASLARSPEEAAAGQGIAPHCADYVMGEVRAPAAWARMIARLPTPYPSSMGYFYSPALARSIQERLRREAFDLIFVHCSSVAPYVRQVTGIPKILDFGDIDSEKWLVYRQFKPFPLSLGYWLEGRKLAAAEKALTHQFDFCTCTTRAELEALRRLQVTTPCDWFPNGVDQSYFAPSTKSYDPDAISFVGRMDYFPNQQAMLFFCDEVFPAIRRQRPSATLTIIGAEPSAGIRRLGEREGVTVTGTVPDVREPVRRSAVNVAPLAIARGTQNKILECMAMGVPVVTSPEAAGGVDAVPEEHLLVAQSPQDYADKLLWLMEDAAARQAFAVAGRARVESHHSWAVSLAKLDSIIGACLERHSAGKRCSA
ncbi:TIGR03087 family PEP-CTERM/XrtA system glycosyltransferase [Pelagibius marinus]|uniref:TIGR03087 family PEP-CTERM/XrtA system glycosyltransferase n=1 Tax=Pelagibius marinus TaxID=2762760 RepID=UPI0018730725|nr:TIGR03087 family PEP-CTERM/XrtA system glycosyltransferase [Pelagibius marinus]